MRYCMMYRKAEQRTKSIGVFIRDEMMIAMGAVPWIYKKLYLVYGPTLNFLGDNYWVCG